VEEKYLVELEKNSWFSKLPSHFQNSLLKHAVTLSVDKDQTVFYSGDVFDGIYAVLEGAIGLGSINIEGKEAVSAIVEPILSGLVKSHWWMSSRVLITPSPARNPCSCIFPRNLFISWSLNILYSGFTSPSS